MSKFSQKMRKRITQLLLIASVTASAVGLSGCVRSPEEIMREENINNLGSVRANERYVTFHSVSRKEISGTVIYDMLRKDWIVLDPEEFVVTAYPSPYKPNSIFIVLAIPPGEIDQETKAFRAGLDTLYNCDLPRKSCQKEFSHELITHPVEIPNEGILFTSGRVIAALSPQPLV